MQRKFYSIVPLFRYSSIPIRLGQGNSGTCSNEVPSAYKYLEEHLELNVLCREDIILKLIGKIAWFAVQGLNFDLELTLKQSLFIYVL